MHIFYKATVHQNKHQHTAQDPQPTPTRTFRTVLRRAGIQCRQPRRAGSVLRTAGQCPCGAQQGAVRPLARAWHSADYPGNGGRHDTGINLVAEEHHTGQHAAIQRKFYAPRTQVVRDDVNKLLGAYGTTRFDYGIIIYTSDNWTAKPPTP